MRSAKVFMHEHYAGDLIQLDDDSYQFRYDHAYQGPPISLTLPIQKQAYEFDSFPTFFDGLLPEGDMLQTLLKRHKIDEEDYLSQLIQTGEDLIGAVTVRAGE